MVNCIAIARLLLVGLVLNSCATQKASKAPKDPFANQLKQANELARNELLKEAVVEYRKVLKANPNHKLAKRNLGIVQLKLKNYAGAEELLASVIKDYDSDFDANFSLAEALRAQDKFGDAIFRYKKALEKKPSDLGAQKALAWSFYKIRYHTEALDIAKKLQRKHPHDVQVSLIFARTLLKLDKTKQALAEVSRIKPFAAKNDLAYVNSVEADIYAGSDRCSQAIVLYKEALKAQPLLAGPLFGLGKCQIGIGKTQQGIDYVQRALRVKPNLTEAALVLAKTFESIDRKKSLDYYRQFKKLALKDPEYLDQIKGANGRIAILQRSENTKSSEAGDLEKDVEDLLGD